MAADACDICYSIVVPVFNEEAVLPVLLRRLDILMAELDGPAETIFVDDASTDCSSIILRDKAKTDPRYRYIGLSRNFGHQVAISAGNSPKLPERRSTTRPTEPVTSESIPSNRSTISSKSTGSAMKLA